MEGRKTARRNSRGLGDEPAGRGADTKERCAITAPRRPSSLFRGRTVKQTEIKKSRNEYRKEADRRTIKKETAG